ncbi:actin cytoskeleton-regulatory complex protein pan1-like [Magnolia sinica]|uniref:actin cytoskeleton-regulatory complex protein pan1-like n=1 Tax=Magnolia sinica TaxID=86752 RepID=UPI0026582859|nr:actin cytoskeleton-regulatory complex protein pan1-like [Magnolia sinica]
MEKEGEMEKEKAAAGGEVGHGARGRGNRGRGAHGRGTRDTCPTRAHPTPIVEDSIPEVLIQSAPPVEPIVPASSIAPVPPLVPPPQPTVPITEAPTPSAAPIPPSEVSVAPAIPTVPIGVEHFQQLVQLVATTLRTRQPTTVEVSRQSNLPQASVIAQEFR